MNTIKMTRMCFKKYIKKKKPLEIINDNLAVFTTEVVTVNGEKIDVMLVGLLVDGEIVSSVSFQIEESRTDCNKVSIQLLYDTYHKHQGLGFMNILLEKLIKDIKKVLYVFFKKVKENLNDRELYLFTVVSKENEISNHLSQKHFTKVDDKSYCDNGFNLYIIAYKKESG